MKIGSPYLTTPQAQKIAAAILIPLAILSMGMFGEGNAYWPLAAGVVMGLVSVGTLVPVWRNWRGPEFRRIPVEQSPSDKMPLPVPVNDPSKKDWTGWMSPPAVTTRAENKITVRLSQSFQSLASFIYCRRRANRIRASTIRRLTAGCAGGRRPMRHRRYASAD